MRPSRHAKRVKRISNEQTRKLERASSQIHHVSMYSIAVPEERRRIRKIVRTNTKMFLLTDAMVFRGHLHVEPQSEPHSQNKCTAPVDSPTR